MTNKSIRDYINLIESAQAGVAEGSESGAKILYTGKDKSGTVTISYEPDYIPGHSEKYIIRFDGKVKSEMPTLKSAVYGLTHYQFDTFRPDLQPNPKTVLQQGVAEGSESDAYGNTGEKHECGSCDGTGIDTYNDECPECGGKGWVRDKEE